MTAADLQNLFEEALETDALALGPQTVIADVPEWNSLAWLTIMSLIDERYGIQVEPRAMRGATTVGELIAYIQGRQTEKS